jgi:hypothetical protein
MEILDRRPHLLPPKFGDGGIFWMMGFYRSLIIGGGIDARRD